MSNHEFPSRAGERIGKLTTAINDAEFDIQRVLRHLDRGDTDRAKLVLIGMQARIGGVKKEDARLHLLMYETPPITEKRNE